MTSKLSKKIMTKLEFQIHLNLFHSLSSISEFSYLLDRKTRKKGYVTQSTLQWYFENGRMGDLLRKCDKARFNSEYLAFTQP